MKKRLKIVLSIIFILFAIFVGIIVYIMNSNNTKENIDDGIDITDENREITDKVFDLEQNNISGKYSDINIVDTKTAKASIEAVKEKIGINSVDDELQPTVSDTNGEYINTYKFQQLYKGVEVYSGGLIIYTDKQGNTKGIINKYNKIPSDFCTDPINENEDLQEIVLESLNNENTQIKNSKLIIYYLGNNEYILAHEYTVEANQEETKIIVADNSKEIIDKTVNVSTSNILTISKAELDNFAMDLNNTNTYSLKDDNRHLRVKCENTKSGNLDDYIWSINDIDTNSNNATIKSEKLDLKLGYDTLGTVQKVYDYYKEKFSINSVKGNEDCWINIVTGATTSKKIDYSNNAFWDSNNMIVYGSNNLYNYDIETTAHEYLHGIMMYKLGTKNEKDYQRQILEEAYGDILGMCAESYYSKKSNIDGIMNIINRNIKDANLVYNDIPQSYKDFKKAKKSDKDEHYYSVIISKAAYIMSENLTLEELEKLWFNSIDLLTERETTINDCYYAVVRTSQILNFSEEKQNIIKQAFENVGFGKIEIYDDSIKDIKNTENEIENNNFNTGENETINRIENVSETGDKTGSNSNNDNENKNEYNSEKTTEKTTINKLTKDQAENIIKTNFKDWKGIQLNYQYNCKVKDSNGKVYYAINIFSLENYYNYGGEWLEEVESGKFYAGTYYVCSEYSNDVVKVGKNQRDWQKYKEGDTVLYFLQSFNLSTK